MRYISLTVRPKDWFDVIYFRVEFAEVFSQGIEQFLQGCIFAIGDVEHLVGVAFGGKQVLCGGGEGFLVGLDDVVDVGEVAGVFAPSVDNRRFQVHQFTHPQRDDRGIGSRRILSASEDIEIAEPDTLNAIDSGKYVGIELIYIFGDGIGGEGLADGFLHFGQCFRITVGRGAGSVHEPFNAGLSGGGEHIHEASHVNVVGGHRVLYGAGHTAQGGLVQDIAAAVHGLATVAGVTDIAFDQGEARVMQRFRKVFPLAGGEIIESVDFISPGEEMVGEVGADKAGGAGDKDFMHVIF